MIRSPMLLLCGLLAACGHVLYGAVSAQTTIDPDVMYACIKRDLSARQFRVTAHDDKDRRLTAERKITDARVSSVLFRKRVDQLETIIRPDNSGNTALEVRSHTFDEFSNAGGVTRDEHPASETAKAAADSLVQACGS